MKAIIILMALLPYSLLAEHLFREVEIQEESWEVVFHSDGIRYRIEIDDVYRGMSKYLQRLELRKDEELKLVEKHHSIVVKYAKEKEGLNIAMTYREPKSAELKISKTFEPKHGVDRDRTPHH